MVYPFVKYSDETEVVFSDIKINENGEETLFVHLNLLKCGLLKVVVAL